MSAHQRRGVERTAHDRAPATGCPSTPTDSSRTGSAGSAGPGIVDDSGVDLVPGDPPVPITVWRTAENDHDQHGIVPPRLARRLVAAYSLPGEVVLDVTDGHALAAAALHTGRHHRPAWFTDTSALIIGPVTPAIASRDAEADPPVESDTADPDGADPDSDGRPGPVGGQRAAHRRQSLDGTKAAGPPPAGWWASGTGTDASPAGAADDAEPAAVRTGLVVACWPPTTAEAANQSRLGWLLRIAAGLLHPGGCLVILLGADSGHRAGPADTEPLVAAAAEAGLGYLQHIVAVRAGVEADRFTYYASPAELAAFTRDPDTGSAQPGPVRHLRVHADLIVLSRRGNADG